MSDTKKSIETSVQVHELFMELTTTLQLSVEDALDVLDRILEIVNKRS